MGQYINLIGKKFGMLLVESDAGKRRGSLFVNCLCDCGKQTVVKKGHLKNGHTKSCGCKICTLPKHGMRHTPEYRVWVGIRERCYKSYTASYPLYGGRGIKVCDRWLNSFENFFVDMGKKPTSKHSIERNDPDGDYEPSNCRWATSYEQSRNQRTNRWISFNGEKLILADWATRFNVTSAAVSNMIKRKKESEAMNYYHKKSL